MLRRITALLFITLSCAGLRAQVPFLEDQFVLPTIARYEGFNAELVFEPGFGGRLEVHRSGEGPFGVRIIFVQRDAPGPKGVFMVPRITDARCHLLSFNVVAPPAAQAQADGGGAGLTAESITWQYDVYNVGGSVDDSYTLMTSSWDSSTGDLSFETDKTGSTTDPYRTTIPTDSFVNLGTSTPQWDRFDFKDSEQIEYKLLYSGSSSISGSTEILYPQQDPPRTVTAQIVATFDGMDQVNFDFVKLFDDHVVPVRSRPLPLLSGRGLAAIAIVALLAGAALLALRRRAASAVS